MYERLARLIDNSSAIIMLPGDTGTEVELMASLHFDQKLKSKFNLESKPLIVLGDAHDEVMNSKFGEIINKSNNVYKVSDEKEVIEVVEALNRLEQSTNLDDEGSKQLEEKLESYLLRF